MSAGNFTTRADEVPDNAQPIVEWELSYGDRRMLRKALIAADD